MNDNDNPTDADQPFNAWLYARRRRQQYQRTYTTKSTNQRKGNDNE